MLSFNSSNIVSKTKTISRRMFLLSTIKAVVLLGIFGRLGSLQINEGTQYRSLADKNRFRETKVAPPRGIIQDYFGNEIASNSAIYQLHITPDNAPNIDSLFDKHLISFEDDGSMIISSKIDEVNRKSLGLNQQIRIPVSEGMKKYLNRHRKRFNEKN